MKLLLTSAGTNVKDEILKILPKPPNELKLAHIITASTPEQNKNYVINEIIAVRIANISSIVEKMENNKWLSKQESAYTYSDESLYVQQQDLAKKLNESR